MNISSQFERRRSNPRKQSNGVNPRGNLLFKSSELKHRPPIKPEIIPSPNKPITLPPETPEVDTLYVAEDYFNEGYA